MKNIRVFVSENFQFLEVKLSIYFNRCVFVMNLSGQNLLTTQILYTSRIVEWKRQNQIRLLDVLVDIIL